MYIFGFSTISWQLLKKSIKIPGMFVYVNMEIFSSWSHEKKIKASTYLIIICEQLDCNDPECFMNLVQIC